MTTKVNLDSSFQQLTDHWSPRVVETVNSQYVKVAKVLGHIAWHKHDDEDEMFLVVKGTLRIQIHEQPEVVLSAGEMCVIPSGTLHNPIAEEECWIVLIETATTKHTGDVETPYTRSIEDQLPPF
jgi:quercetin dioxygenase-like cupin family protein